MHAHYFVFLCANTGLKDSSHKYAQKNAMSFCREYMQFIKFN